MFLRIQDIRTEKPPSYYYAIYLNPPAGQKIDEHTPGFVGNLSLFFDGPPQDARRHAHAGRGDVG